jgi:hypothetical protein
VARKSLIRVLAVMAAVGVAVITGHLAYARHERAVEQANCTAVAQMLGGSPGHKPAFVVREVTHPQQSGNRTLDAAMRYLAAELRGSDTASTNLAFHRAVAICSALGMGTTYH